MISEQEKYSFTLTRISEYSEFNILLTLYCKYFQTTSRLEFDFNIMQLYFPIDFHFRFEFVVNNYLDVVLSVLNFNLIESYP